MTEAVPRLVGVSDAARRLEEDVAQASRSDAKILLTGESGVGKEVAARLVHRQSARSAGPFVAINCAGIPDSLLESSLFGHMRGSFTGAFRDKVGLLEQAHGGTMFMDEVGEMSKRMQGLLLRFLEDGDVYRVGSERRTCTVNVRIVAATNRVLLDRVAEGEFREDLFYRLNVIHLVISPLRERREDIPPLLDYFLRMFSEKYRTKIPEISADLQASLMQHHWPGNVRELKNVAERLIVCGHAGSAIGQSPVEAVRPADATGQRFAALPPVQQPRSASDQLTHRIIQGRESFWTAVYEPFMARDLTRDEVRATVQAGLQHSRGNYKMLLELFNMEPTDYKRFLNFLRKHQCHIPFQQFRTGEALRGSTVDIGARAAS
jgi:transcriptional regulator with PAS, ATPase and Fis domain